MVCPPRLSVFLPCALQPSSPGTLLGTCSFFIPRQHRTPCSPPDEQNSLLTWAKLGPDYPSGHSLIPYRILQKDPAGSKPPPRPHTHPFSGLLSFHFPSADLFLLTLAHTHQTTPQCLPIFYFLYLGHLLLGCLKAWLLDTIYISAGKLPSSRGLANTV